VLFCISCVDKGKADFKKVKSINKISVYEAFIKDNYTSIYVDSALINIEKIDFKQLQTINEFKKFKLRYPKTNKNIDSIIESIEFDLVLKSKKNEELSEFKSKYPKSTYLKTVDSIIAKNKLVSRKKNTSKKSLTGNALRKYVIRELKKFDKDYKTLTKLSGMFDCGTVEIKVNVTTVYITGNSIQYGRCLSSSTLDVLRYKDYGQNWLKRAYGIIHNKGYKTYVTDTAH
jgi:hypothetical protein